MKRELHAGHLKAGSGVPPRFAAASLKRDLAQIELLDADKCSAAIRGGLIEAWLCGFTTAGKPWCSAAIRGGLIEANMIQKVMILRLPRCSAAIRGGLIEANDRCLFTACDFGVPPRFAAASLKLNVGCHAFKNSEGVPPRFAAASLKHLAGF